jgi:hypothetical protein
MSHAYENRRRNGSGISGILRDWEGVSAGPHGSAKVRGPTEGIICLPYALAQEEVGSSAGS